MSEGLSPSEEMLGINNPERENMTEFQKLRQIAEKLFPDLSNEDLAYIDGTGIDEALETAQARDNTGEFTSVMTGEVTNTGADDVRDIVQYLLTIGEDRGQGEEVILALEEQGLLEYLEDVPGSDLDTVFDDQDAQ